MDETQTYEAENDDEERPITPKRPGSLSRRHTAYSYFSQYSTLVEQQHQREQQEEAAEIWNELEDDRDHDEEVENDDGEHEYPNESTALLRRAMNSNKRSRRRSSGFNSLPGRRRRSSLAAHPGTGLSRSNWIWKGLGEWESDWWRMRRWWWWKDKKRDEC